MTFSGKHMMAEVKIDPDNGENIVGVRRINFSATWTEYRVLKCLACGLIDDRIKRT